jgi:hypothetical protein
LNDEVREDGMGMVCSRHEGKRYAYGVLMGKPKENRPLGEPI